MVNVLQVYIKSIKVTNCVKAGLMDVKIIAGTTNGDISMAGLMDVKIVAGTTNGDIFYDFAHTQLLPNLPFNRENPHFIVIMDNCAIHHIAEVVNAIEVVGALVIFPPPYSPDYYPIEEAFSKVKCEFKYYESTLNIFDLETLVLASFSSISSNNCKR